MNVETTQTVAVIAARALNHYRAHLLSPRPFRVPGGQDIALLIAMKDTVNALDVALEQLADKTGATLGNLSCPGKRPDSILRNDAHYTDAPMQPNHAPDHVLQELRGACHQAFARYQAEASRDCEFIINVANPITVKARIDLTKGFQQELVLHDRYLAARRALLADLSWGH